MITRTLTLDGVDFEVIVTPAEPTVMYYKDGSGYPGSPAELEITSITGNCESLMEIISGIYPDVWVKLEDKLLEDLTD